MNNETEQSDKDHDVQGCQKALANSFDWFALPNVKNAILVILNPKLSVLDTACRLNAYEIVDSMLKVMVVCLFWQNQNNLNKNSMIL